MIYDITPPITERLKVWPGDTPPTRDVLLDISKGDSVTLSTLRATVHLGAHADAPNHYGAEARGIDERCLDLYLGTCQVIRVNVDRGTRIGPGALPASIRATRVLLATHTYPDPNVFNEDFVGIFIETPIGYRHAWVYFLQFSLERQEKCSVPGEKERQARRTTMYAK